MIPTLAPASSSSSSPSLADVEELLVCPIGGAPPKDPVVAADGYTYDRQLLEGWWQCKGFPHSPQCNMPLPNGQLVPNRLARDIMACLPQTRDALQPPGPISWARSDLPWWYQPRSARSIEYGLAVAVAAGCCLKEPLRIGLLVTQALLGMDVDLLGGGPAWYNQAPVGMTLATAVGLYLAPDVSNTVDRQVLQLARRPAVQKAAHIAWEGAKGAALTMATVWVARAEIMMTSFALFERSWGYDRPIAAAAALLSGTAELCGLGARVRKGNQVLLGASVGFFLAARLGTAAMLIAMPNLCDGVDGIERCTGSPWNLLTGGLGAGFVLRNLF